jgi:hypothetical protein
MPEEVLGPQGYITINQSNLKSLSLTVDGSCPGHGLDGLAHLDNLQYLSWRGVVTKRNFELFRKVVEHNAHHLVTLDVEVVRRPVVSRPSRQIDLDLIWLGLLVPSERHIGRVTEASSVKNELRLNSLVSLSLRNVSLAAWKSDDVLTFDPARLIKLTLDYCAKTLRFFETWDSRNHGLSLRSFRGMIDERWGTRTTFPIESLLSKYGSRLEDFYISFTDNFAVNIDFQLYRPYLKRMVLSFLKKRLGVRSESSLPDQFSIQSLLQVLSGLEGVAFTRSPYTMVSQYERGVGP